MQNLKTVDFGVAFTLTRPAPADYEDKDGNTQTAAANEPRFNYSNGVAQGLLLDASLSETAAIDDVPAFNASAGHWIIDATFDDSEPLKGMGLNEVFVGSGKMVVSYSGGTAKVWAGGQTIHTVASYTPAEPTHICEGGMATIGGLTYKPSAISDADAAALATGDFEIYVPFSPSQLFSEGQQGAWYDPSDLATLFEDAVGSDPVTADNDMTGLALDKHLGLELGPELVTNGTFDTDVNGWQITTTYPTFTIASVNGHLRMEGGNPSGTTYGAKQDMAFQQGKTYQLSFDLISGPTNRYVRVLDVSGGVVRSLAVGSDIGIGTNNLIFTAQSNESGLSFEVFRDGVAEWDNISVRELPGNHATQDTTAAKPTYRTDGTLQWLEFDGDDDALVANIPGITNATVAIAKSTGTEITYPVDLSSGTFTMNETNYGVIIREGEFTEQETLDVTEYLNAKAGIS